MNGNTSKYMEMYTIDLEVHLLFLFKKKQS